METENLVLVEQFCAYHNVEITFINALQDYGLVEIVTVKQNNYLPYERVKDVEKMIRLHYEMDINLEGIDAIANLLNRVEALQGELNMVRNRLRFYEK
ncbi:chaperone modulator CbpM [Flavobacterium rhizosphaerae]|uniref:Chaperone modulator CbpM n=1 Tax=Flavobacterium rhizosphaerae TaxID=3163298 RepID=A0ABW8YWC8_9FLAO